MSNEEGADATHQAQPRRRYDVFLSFRGIDTRYSFARNLYNALRRKRFNTFMDDEGLEGGTEISPSPSIFKAIEESRISIVIFSPNYAGSVCCLEELVNIVGCMERKNQLVWPIFYEVDPSEVRRQLGHFAEPMARHGERFGVEKVGKWRSALTEVSNMSGWHFGHKGKEYEYELIEKIVELAVQSLPRYDRYDIFLSFSGEDTRYDIFLCFSEEDTRYSFTGFLYKALQREGFKTFMDDKALISGNNIASSFLEAIEKARLSIIVFSENYGYSTDCLDELAKIIECMQTKNQLVWPIFYKVEQSDVSNQTNSYGDAIAAHEERFGKDSDKVQYWKSALSQVANLKGWHFKTGYEYEFIQMIVDKAIDMENHMYLPSPSSH